MPAGLSDGCSAHLCGTPHMGTEATVSPPCHCRQAVSEVPIPESGQSLLSAASTFSSFGLPGSRRLASAGINGYYRNTRAVVRILDGTLNRVWGTFNTPASISIRNLTVSISVERIVLVRHSCCREIAASCWYRQSLLSNTNAVAPSVRITAPNPHRGSTNRDPSDIGLGASGTPALDGGHCEDKIQRAID